MALARSFVASTLSLLGASDEAVEEGRLVVSELVSAAVRSDGGPVAVEVLADGGVRVTCASTRPELSDAASAVLDATVGTRVVEADRGWLLVPAGRPA